MSSAQPDQGEPDPQRSAEFLFPKQACPDGINPLLDLPSRVEEFDSKKMIDALDCAYRGAVARGIGLIAILAGPVSSRGEARLSEQIERELGPDRDSSLNNLLIINQAEEQHLAWACEQLELEAELVFLEIRRRLLIQFDYGDEPSEQLFAELRPPVDAFDRESERLLTERAGDCPGWHDPLASLPARIAQRSRSEQVQALIDVFADKLIRLAGLEDVLCRVDSEIAAELISEIDSPEEFRDTYRACTNNEACFVWASEALGIPTTLVLNQIETLTKEKHD